MEFDRYTVVLLMTPRNPPELSEEATDALQDAHLDHLAKLHEAGHLLAAGPLPGEPGRKFRGISIFRSEPDQTRVLAEQDPAVRAGWFELEVLPWLTPAGALDFSSTRFPHSAAEADA
jgi:uncharacterized protein